MRLRKILLLEEDGVPTPTSEQEAQSQVVDATNATQSNNDSSNGNNLQTNNQVDGDDKQTLTTNDDSKQDEVKLDPQIRKMLGVELEELATLMVNSGIKTEQQLIDLINENINVKRNRIDSSTIQAKLLKDLYQWADNKDNNEKLLFIGSKYSGTKNKIIEKLLQDKVLMALRVALVNGFGIREQGVTFIGMFAQIAIATSYSVKEQDGVQRIIVPNRNIQSIMSVLYTSAMRSKSSQAKESLVKILLISLNKGDVQPNKVENDLPQYIDSIFNGDEEEFRLKAWIFMSDPYKKQGYGMSGSISFGSPIGEIESTRNPYAQEIRNRLNDVDGKTRICDLSSNLMKALFQAFEKNVTMLKNVLAEKDDEWDEQDITAPTSIRKLYFQNNQSIKTLLYRLQILLTIAKKQGYPKDNEEIKNFVTFFYQFLGALLRVELPNAIDSDEECGKIVERFIQTYREKNKAMFVNLNRVVSIKDKQVNWASYKSNVTTRRGDEQS